MLKSELLEIIANGENSGVEFKRDDDVLPVAGTSFDFLDLDRLNYYLESIIKDPDMPKTKEEWSDHLLGLGFSEWCRTHI